MVNGDKNTGGQGRGPVQRHGRTGKPELHGSNAADEEPEDALACQGTNNLAKALYQKENRELTGTIGCYTDGLISAKPMQETVETLSAAKAPKKDGEGNPCVDVANAHMPLPEAVQTVSRKAFKEAFC